MKKLLLSFFGAVAMAVIMGVLLLIHDAGYNDGWRTATKESARHGSALYLVVKFAGSATPILSPVDSVGECWRDFAAVSASELTQRYGAIQWHACLSGQQADRITGGGAP